MLSFGRVALPYGAIPHEDAAAAALPFGKVPAEVEEKEQTHGMDRQYRSRYYAAVLPAAVPGLPRQSSHPPNGSTFPIPSAAGSVSRFARSSLSSAQPSHSLPSVLPRSQPIDIPTGRRSVPASAAAAALWHRKAWQGAADETDSSGSSAGSGDSDAEEADDWCVGGRRQLSGSFVDDSQLQWSGRCLDDGAADFTDFRDRLQLDDDEERSARSHKRARRLRFCTADGDVAEDDSDDDDADGALPFPLLAPSYHVDFELN